MYIAFYINDKDDDKTIVICEPYFDKAAPAWAILSAKEGITGGLFVGDKNDIVELLNELNDIRGWPKDDVRVIPAIEKIANKYMVKILSQQSGDDSLKLLEAIYERAEIDPLFKHRVSEIIEAGKKTLPPKIGYYPNGINPKAKKVWDKMIEQYFKEINKFKPYPIKQWAAAIIIFKRLCLKNNVRPFLNVGDDWYKNQAREIERRMEAGNKRADGEVEGVNKQLLKNKVITSFSDEKFYEVAKIKGLYYVTSYRSIILNIDPKAFFYKMKAEFSFNTGKSHAVQYAHRQVDSYTDILYELESSKLIHAYVTSFLTRDQLITVLGLNKELDDKIVDDRLLKDLEIAAKRWLRGGKLVKGESNKKGVITSEFGVSYHSSDKWNLLNHLHNPEINDKKYASAILVEGKEINSLFLCNVEAEEKTLEYFNNHLLSDFVDPEIYIEGSFKFIPLTKNKTEAAKLDTENVSQDKIGRNVVLVIEKFLKKIKAKDIVVRRLGYTIYRWVYDNSLVPDDVYSRMHWEIKLFGRNAHIGVFDVNPYYKVVTAPITIEKLQEAYDSILKDLKS